MAAATVPLVAIAPLEPIAAAPSMASADVQLKGASTLWRNAPENAPASTQGTPSAAAAIPSVSSQAAIEIVGRPTGSASVRGQAGEAPGPSDIELATVPLDASGLPATAVETPPFAEHGTRGEGGNPDPAPRDPTPLAQQPIWVQAGAVGATIGKGSQDAAVKTGRFFSRFAKSVAGSF
jgi:hypothetical protein